MEQEKEQEALRLTDEIANRGNKILSMLLQVWMLFVSKPFVVLPFLYWKLVNGYFGEQ